MPVATLTGEGQITVRTALGLVVGAKVVGPGAESIIGLDTTVLVRCLAQEQTLSAFAEAAATCALRFTRQSPTLV